MSFRKTTYSKQPTQSFCWETKNRDFFKIVSNFMNFFNITSQIKYVLAYQNQKQKRSNKSDSNRVFDAKIIIDSSSRTRFQITSKNESDFKKERWKK